MKTLSPLKNILLMLPIMQLLTSTVHGQPKALEDQPFGHPYVHQQGHHPANHPQLGGNEHNVHHRDSKKRGSKRSGKRDQHHPWNGNNFHSRHGKHSKRYGPNNSHHHAHEHGEQHTDYHTERDRNDKRHSDSHIVSAAESNTNTLQTPISASSLSSSSVSVSLSSPSSSSSSLKAKNEQSKDVVLPTDKTGESMGGMIEVETLKIHQTEPSRIETESLPNSHSSSIEINVISEHVKKHSAD